MGRPKGSKNKLKGTEGQDRESYSDIQDRESYTVKGRGRPKGSKNKPASVIAPVQDIVNEVLETGVDIIESKRPEYEEDSKTIKISGAYNKLSNGKTLLYCYRDECWKYLDVCMICGRECDSMRMLEGKPIIHRRTKRQMRKDKK
jgi:hypothetical protein